MVCLQQESLKIPQGSTPAWIHPDFTTLTYNTSLEVAVGLPTGNKLLGKIRERQD